MHAFDHARRRNVKLRQFGVEDRLLVFHVAAARFPADPRAAGRQRERRDGVAAGCGALHGHGLRRKHVHVQVRQRERRAVDQSGRHGQRESAVGVAPRHLDLILHLDVECAAGLRDQLLCVARTGGRRFELQRFRIIDLRQHRRLEQQRQRPALFRLPVDFCRCGGETVFDADLLDDGFRQRVRGAAGQRPAQQTKTHQHCGGRRHDGGRRQEIGFGSGRHAPELLQERNRDVHQQKRSDDGQKRRDAVGQAQRRPGEEGPAENSRQEFLFPDQAGNPEHHREGREQQRTAVGKR